MRKNLLGGGGETLVNNGFAAHCITCGSVRLSRAKRAALAIVTAVLLFVCGVFGGLSWLPVVGGVLEPLTVHAARHTIILSDGGATISGEPIINVTVDNVPKTSLSPGSYVLELANSEYGFNTSDDVVIIVTGNFSIRELDLGGFNVILTSGGGNCTLSIYDKMSGMASGKTLTIENGLTLDIHAGGAHFFIDGTLTNNGKLVTSGDVAILGGSLINNGTMTNQDKLTVSSSGATSGTFTNNGTFTNEEYGTVSNYGATNNNGTINNSGTLTNNGDFNNNNNGIINNSGALTNTGTFDNSTGTINNSGTITGITGGIINQISLVPAAPASPCATGHASYTWQTVTSADVHNDGEMVFACAGCGHVLYRVPVSAYGPFQKVTAEMIRNAAQGATVEIATSRWISFHRSVMEALAARPDVTLTISFLDGEYRGNRRIVTIPAGYDTLSLLNGTDYCGFLYLGSKFGLK